MATWSHRRKSIYLGILVMLAVIFIGVPGFFAFYEKPTCSDRKQNGRELGIDCGGPCQKLCNSAFLKIPAPQWVRFKEAGTGIYNVAAYLINPNPNGLARNVPFVIELVGNNGITIGKSDGFVTLVPGRNTLAFGAGVSTNGNIPVRAIFKFKSEPDWNVSTDRVRQLETLSKDYSEDEVSSSLYVTFRNNGSDYVRAITVYAILRDEDENTLDFSKTIIDEIAPGGTALAPFTWPVTHNGRVISIEVLPVAE